MPADSGLNLSNIYALVPFDQWEYKDVTFPTANTPLRVSHGLKPKTPQDVIYFVARQSSSAVISDGTLQPSYNSEWTQSSIVLQSTVAGTVTMLLAVPKKKISV